MEIKVIFFLFLSMVLFPFMAHSNTQISATINIEATLNTSNKVTIKGTTNLPDETELHISISNDITGAYSPTNYIVVKNNSFQSKPIGPEGGYDYGRYRISVVMPAASNQPLSVKKIIGYDGELLTGPYVSDSVFGKIVENEGKFSLGSQEQVNQAEKIHLLEVEAVFSGIEDLIHDGRAMQKFRNSYDLNDARICGNTMRRNQSTARALRNRADALPFLYMDLRKAAFASIGCVSCSASALKDCSFAAESLAQLPLTLKDAKEN